MSGKYECDCGAVYSHHDQLIECADRNHGQLDRNHLCGRRFGEILLPGLKAGSGIPKFCMLFKNHSGDCDVENPELTHESLGYRPGDLGD